MSTYQNRTVAGHKSQITVIAMMILAQLVPTLAWAAGTKPSSGNGSASSPYQISTKEHLIWFRDVVNGVNTGVSTGASNAQSICGRLTADITSLGSWTAIGKDSDHKYAGTFDGDGHKITGLSGSQGLFGYTNDATVQKFTLEGSISPLAGDLGSVVGTAGGNTHVFDVCSKVNITISGAVKHLGGIVGQYPATSGKELRIKGCTYAGAMDVGSSTDSNGGIIGYCGESANVEIEYCHFSGSITTSANNPRLGGILGYADDDNAQNFGYIQYCFLSGYVKTTYTNPTTTYIGIIAGYPRGNVPGVIKNNTYIANSKNSSTNLVGNGYNSTVTASTKNNKQITISVSGGSGGSTSWEYVNPTQTTWAKVQATATANSGKHLAKWTSSSSSSTAISTQTTYTTDLSSSVGLYANFADHTYGSWITDKEAACLAQGKRHKVCTVCSDTQYDYPAAKGHGHGTGTKAGYTALYEWGTTDAPICEFHLTCNDCSTKVRKTTIGTDASNTNGYYELTTDQAATCTATGVHAYTAWGKYSDSNGSATYDEKTSTSHPSSYKSGNYTVPKIAHTWVNNREHLKSAATCTADAVYWQSCSKCHEQGTKTWTDTGTKTGHTWVNNREHLKSAATCTADAVYWQSCSKCHEQGTDTWTDTGTKKDHDYGNYPNNGFGNCSMCHKEAYQPIEQGDGTEDDPYKIANAGQLYWFAAQVNGGNYKIHGQLTKDIVVNDGTFETDTEGNVSFRPTSAPSSTVTPRSWTPIGTEDKYFQGTFNGDNHTVSGLYLNDSQAEIVGLFGYISDNVTIQKLGVINVYFVGNINVGGVVGHGYNHCTIDHCYTTGVVKGNSNVGGIISYTNINCKVTDCYSTATISGNGTLGGIAGNIDNDSSVERCYFAGSINDGDYTIGGIAGNCNNNSTIKDCYSTATISGNSDIGGIAGNLQNNSSIQTCYSTSSIVGDSYLGGICGSITTDDCTLSDCYTDHETLCGDNANDEATNITECEQGVITDRFKSGEVACKLYKQSNVWRQNLGTNPDPSPVLDDTHGRVYSGYLNCTEQGYANTELPSTPTNDHVCSSYDNGFGTCSRCHKELYQPIEEGDGSDENPYKIANAGQLYWFAAQVNGGNNSIHGQLTKDIVVNDGTFTTDDEGNVSFHPNSAPSTTTTPRSWTPIGTWYNRFQGTFDGNNHNVSGLYFNDSQAEYVGLFGYITTKVTIQELRIVNVYFVGNNKVGGVVGYGDNYCTIDHCYTTGLVKGSSTVGGIVGDTNINCKVTVCYSTATISGNGTLGGIAGNIDNDSSVERCYFAGSINDGYCNIGGIAGNCNTNSTIKDCYSTATLSGNSDIGGIAGNMQNNSSIQTCYSTSSIVGDSYLGGICGSITTDGGSLSYCYTDNQTLCGDNANEETTNITNCEQGVTTDRFKSGEVAFKLYRQSNVWRQNLGTNPDPSPVLDSTHGRVYSGYLNCTEQGYANTKLPSTPTNNHVCSSYDSNGFGTCSKCQSEVYQPIEQGDGSQNNPYKIANAGQLYWFAAKVNGGNNKIHGQLTKDIAVNDGTFTTDDEGNVSFHPTSAPSTTVTPRSWTPIGTDDKRFQGTFDGDNHTISGLYFNNSLAQYVGLFGYVCDIVTIQKLGVINVYFVGNNNVGGVVGYGEQNCSIDHCYTTGVLKASEAQDCSDPFMRSYTAIGGIVGGISNNCKVTDCYSSAAISGDSFLGGIAGGIKDSSSVERCYFTGSINDGVFDIGGITGSCQKSTIKDCYSTATISGQIEIGGIAGLIEEESSIENCYSTSSLVDGICGSMSSNCTLSYCYTDNETLCGDNENAKGTNISNCEQEVTADRFKSGEVACKLYEQSKVWRQNLTGETPDPSPVLDDTHGVVYSGYVNCTEQGYANTWLPSTPGEHVCSSYDSNGFGTCSKCKKEAYQPATGDGSEEKPYLIANAGQLYWFAAQVNGGNNKILGQLTKDIVVNDGTFETDTLGNVSFHPTSAPSTTATPRNWTPIGTMDDRFQGIFDGDYHTVSGLYINDRWSILGLFGILDGNSEVKHLGVINAYFNGYWGGGIAAAALCSTITDCYTNAVIMGEECIGGICGESICGIIRLCYTTGTVSGNYGAGGICGWNLTDESLNLDAVIEYCYSTATIYGECSAGICGVNESKNGNQYNCIYACHTTSDQVVADNKAREIDINGNFASLTLNQFKSGEVTCMMNYDFGEDVWRQNLGTNPDPSPVLDDTHGVVYYGYVNCTEKGYANTELPSTPGEHSIGEDGGCDVCGYNKPKVEVVYNATAKTMTWYYGRESHAADSVTVYTLPDYTKQLDQEPAWIENINPEKVIFDASMADYRPVSCHSWFYSLGDIKEFQGLQYLNTSKVRNMGWMFYYCTGLQSLDLHTFVTDSVTDMALMFYGCNQMKELTLCFNTANVTNLNGMFDSCYELTTIYSSCDFVLNESLGAENHMFGYATKLKGGQGTEYSGSHSNHDYARIDDPEHGRPGYFTQYYAPGDVNQNGTISLSDLCSLITYVGATTFPSQADMNHDGAITEADVALLRDLLLGR